MAQTPEREKGGGICSIKRRHDAKAVSLVLKMVKAGNVLFREVDKTVFQFLARISRLEERKGASTHYTYPFYSLSTPVSSICKGRLSEKQPRGTCRVGSNWRWWPQIGDHTHLTRLSSAEPGFAGCSEPVHESTSRHPRLIGLCFHEQATKLLVNKRKQGPELGKFHNINTC